MKKNLRNILFTLVVTLVITFKILCPVKAAEQNTNDQVIYTDNGYIIVTITESDSIQGNSSNGTRESYQKTATSTYRYYSSNNELQWDVVLTGTFNYNYITAHCVSATANYHIYNSFWQKDSLTPSLSGNTARADFTFKLYSFGIVMFSVTDYITISCSPNGTIS